MSTPLLVFVERRQLLVEVSRLCAAPLRAAPWAPGRPSQSGPTCTDVPRFTSSSAASASLVGVVNF
eukprot:16444853-Heterocapsa_arctica.AAC.1